MLEELKAENAFQHNKNTIFRSLFSFRRKEIDLLFSASRLVKKNSCFKLLLAGTSDKHGKLLIIIPGSTGKAHKRNKVRRQIKSIFYENKMFLKNKIYILIVYKSALELEFGEIRDFLIKNT